MGGGGQTQNKKQKRNSNQATSMTTHICMGRFNLAIRLLPARHMGSMCAGQWPLPRLITKQSGMEGQIRDRGGGGVAQHRVGRCVWGGSITGSLADDERL